MSPSNNIKKLIVNNKTICLEIWDTCGSHSFRNINEIFCKNAKFILLMYNITNRKTFDEIKNYYYEKMKILAGDASIIILY